MHSRLSDYPFLAGFHVTRAALRDIYVMGAKPVALLSDIHLADDGDVAKLFKDRIAGIATVSELIHVPLMAARCASAETWSSATGSPAAWALWASPARLLPEKMPSPAVW